MSAKTSSPRLRGPGQEPPAGPWHSSPSSTEERLQRIAAMGQRVNGYLDTMSKVGNQSGTSAEAKDKAIVAFYECMVAMERQLGRIQEELQLG